MNADEIKRLREIAEEACAEVREDLAPHEEPTIAEVERENHNALSHRARTRPIYSERGIVQEPWPLPQKYDDEEIVVLLDEIADRNARLHDLGRGLLSALSRLAALEAENARLRDAARLALRLAMRDFSEDNYCAGWNSGLDELIASNDCEKAKSIKALADLCGGWWRWDYTVERARFVPMDEWRELAALDPSDSSGARKETQ